MFIALTLDGIPGGERIYIRSEHIVSVRSVAAGSSVVTIEMRQDESWIVQEQPAVIMNLMTPAK